jgi:hypothetical protein
LIFGLCAVLGCTTTYHLRVRTYPPQAAPVYINGELKGETSERGELRFSSTHSIFAKPELEVRKGDRRGALILRYAETTLALENVAMALSHDAGIDRNVNVVFALREIPVPEPLTYYTSGRNTLVIRNASSLAVWVSIREEHGGSDLLLSEGEHVRLAYPDGRHRIYLVYEGEEDTLFVLDSDTVLDGNVGVAVIPSREDRADLTRRIGDPAYLGM